MQMAVLCSAFFPEETEAKRSRRLIFPLFAKGDNNQNHKCHNIGEHFVKLLDSEVCSGGDVKVQNVAAAEQDRGQHTDEGEIHGTVVTHIERETAADPAQQGQRDKNTDLMAGPWLRAEKEKAPCGRETDDEAEGADKNHIPLYDRTHRCLL